VRNIPNTALPTSLDKQHLGSMFMDMPVFGHCPLRGQKILVVSSQAFTDGQTSEGSRATASREDGHKP